VQINYLVDKGVSDGTCFVCAKDGIPVGVLGALIVPNLYNPEYITLAEAFWYVLPEYRETRAGAMLLKAFHDRASEIANEATMSLLIESSVIKIESLEKRGFMLKEFGFVKRF